MVPTLQVGQRVLVNRIGNRFTDPKVGEVIVFHPPKGVGHRHAAATATADRARPCDKPTPTRAGVNFIKRVVGLPGDKIYDPRRPRLSATGKREQDSYISAPARRRRPRLQLHDADHRSRQATAS